MKSPRIIELCGIFLYRLDQLQALISKALLAYYNLLFRNTMRNHNRDSSPKRKSKEKPNKTYNYGCTKEAKQTVLTPDNLFKFLNDEFDFLFDPCPFPAPKWDGLKKNWTKCNYVNPPYNKIQGWLEKGIEECKKGNTSVYLIPARTDRKYWRELIYPLADEIRFITSPVTFTRQTGEVYPHPSPFALAIVIYTPKKKQCTSPYFQLSGPLEHFSFQKFEPFKDELQQVLPQMMLCVNIANSKKLNKKYLNKWRSEKYYLRCALFSEYKCSRCPESLRSVILPLCLQLLQAFRIAGIALPTEEKTVNLDKPISAVDILLYHASFLENEKTRKLIEKNDCFTSIVGQDKSFALLNSMVLKEAAGFLSCFRKTYNLRLKKRLRQSHALKNDDKKVTMHAAYM